MRGWRAWYDDGAVYSSARAPVGSLPGTGILGVVMYKEPPYRVILDGGDWYWVEDGKWKTTANSIWGDWVDPPDVDSRLLKRSGSLPNDEWAEVRKAMHEAKDWP